MYDKSLKIDMDEYADSMGMNMNEILILRY